MVTHWLRALGLRFFNGQRLLLRLGLALAVATAFPAYCWAATVTGTVNASVSFRAVTTITTGASSTIDVKMPANLQPGSFTDGTGAFQVNKLWARTLSLSASTPVTLDLTSLASGYGDTNFSAVKVLAIVNHETTAAKVVTVGNAASAQFQGPLSVGTTTFTVDGGASQIFYSSTAAGWTTSSKNNLKLDPGANAVSCTVVIAGN